MTKQLHEFQKENERLQTPAADQALDMLILERAKAALSMRIQEMRAKPAVNSTRTGHGRVPRAGGAGGASPCTIPYGVPAIRSRRVCSRKARFRDRESVLMQGRGRFRCR